MSIEDPFKQKLRDEYTSETAELVWMKDYYGSNGSGFSDEYVFWLEEQVIKIKALKPPYDDID